MADVITGNTQLGAVKNDLIIALVQKELKFAAKLLPYVTDYSAFAGKGVKSVGVPKLSSFTVVDRATATAGDASALTTAKDVIDLDINAYVSWLIDSSDEVQASIDSQLEFAKRAAASHGRFVDEKIIAVLEASAGLDAGAAPLTRDLVLDMREYLLKADADPSELVLLISMAQEKALLKIDEFSRADVYGSAVIPSGMIGRVFGVPVVMHNGLADAKAYMFSKSGVGIAFQLQPKMAEQSEIAYGTSAKRVAIDQLFGIEALQQGEKGTTAPASPLITKI
jgi:hypothetical protein